MPAVLGIGTAQFGFDYGVTNQRGQVPRDEVAEILQSSSRQAVDLLDTAPVYGTSEEVIGELSESQTFRIVTKVPARVPGETMNFVATAFATSLRRLRRSSVYGLLFHRADDLLVAGGDQLMKVACSLKDSGQVQKIGVSASTGSQIDAILSRFSIDLVQIPLNVLDQRLIESGHLARLKALNIEIHTRSVFLQGVLLQSPDRLPPHLGGVKEHLRRYHEALSAAGLSPVGAALGFAVSQPEVDAIIVGASSLQEWHEILDACSGVRAIPPFPFREFAWQEESTLNPARWPQKSRQV